MGQRDLGTSCVLRPSPHSFVMSDGRGSWGNTVKRPGCSGADGRVRAAHPLREGGGQKVESERDREPGRETERWGETGRQRQVETGRERQEERQKETERLEERETGRYRETEKETETGRRKHTQRERQKQRETWGERDREIGTDRGENPGMGRRTGRCTERETDRDRLGEAAGREKAGEKEEGPVKGGEGLSKEAG